MKAIFKTLYLDIEEKKEKLKSYKDINSIRILHLKDAYSPFRKKGMTSNYRGITLTAITTKIYNPLLQTEFNLKWKECLEEIKMVSEIIAQQLDRFSLWEEL